MRKVPSALQFPFSVKTQLLIPLWGEEVLLQALVNDLLSFTAKAQAGKTLDIKWSNYWKTTHIIFTKERRKQSEGIQKYVAWGTQ